MPTGDAEAAFRQGDDARCAALCQEALTIGGRTAATLHLMGSALVRAGHATEGQAALDEALTLAPTSLQVRFDVAAGLEGQGQIDAAIATVAEGARYHAGDPALASHLATLLSAHGRHDDALAVLAAGVRAQPRDWALRGLLASELAGALRLDEALLQLTLIAQQAPASSEVQVNLGVLRQSLGDLDGAIAHYEAAIRLQPANGLAHVNLATALLSYGDIQRGFAEFEWRRTLPSVRRAASRLPEWTGDPLAGRRLLLTAEQGYGDMIQMIRFVPRLEGGIVIVECPPALVRLFAGVSGVDTCVAFGEPVDADVQASLLSLPHLLGCDARSIAETQFPYLSPPDVSHPWADANFLPSSTPLHPRIGLVWAGLPATGEVYVRRSLNRRSCRLADLAPLGTVPNVALVSLQLGPPAGERASSPFPLIDGSAGIVDFADTAARLRTLDLLISVDTAAAHLAGALGVPLWVMLAPGQCDYRWGRDGASPWYPNVRLFRGDASGWPGLAHAVADALRVGSSRLR